MTDPLDDLPERTTEHVNSDVARWRFRQLVANPYFIVREETDNDYGVDVSVEALSQKVLRQPTSAHTSNSRPQARSRTRTGRSVTAYHEAT
jgi:hypothetical protein